MSHIIRLDVFLIEEKNIIIVQGGGKEDTSFMATPQKLRRLCPSARLARLSVSIERKCARVCVCVCVQEYILYE